MIYSDLYTRACRKGKLRTDEYSKEEFIDDANDLARKLWTTIFQGVNGNRPATTRKEVVTVSGDLAYSHTRTIKKTPILKIVYGGCTYVPQKTDSTALVDCFSFEYDDDEIRFTNSTDGEYEVFYESGEYVPLTVTTYDAGDEPTWLKDDFHPIFWSYTAFLNTDTKKEEMGELYGMHFREFLDYYSRTETLETPYMIAGDTQNQL